MSWREFITHPYVISFYLVYIAVIAIAIIMAEKEDDEEKRRKT